MNADRDSRNAITYQIAMRLSGRVVVVAGGGRVATRRVRRLLPTGARVVVIAPRLTTELAEKAASGGIEWRQREVCDGDLTGAALAFAATDDACVNATFAVAARAQDVPIQRADDAQGSDFLNPAAIDRGPLQIAVSSDGVAPTLTRQLRARLETLVPHAYGDLAALAGEFRERARARIPRDARAAFWNDIFDGPIAEHVFAGRPELARRELKAALASSTPGAASRQGEVYLVGGGPGAPDLLTFRALRLMQRADVVLYDSLIAPAILDLVSPGAERIHVGKRASRHTLAQQGINTLMADLARQGRRVLRLKGGDPFVFGRGGEEIMELAEMGLPFQIVPGITAANGCAAYAGIPLTHRDYAQSVIFATGHLKDGELKLSWAELARPGQTVVFFMGRRNLAIICRQLIEHGLAPDWPAALIFGGTTARQRVLAATLTDLPERADAEESRDAALLIVGEVVRLHGKLGWFDPGKSE